MSFWIQNRTLVLAFISPVFSKFSGRARYVKPHVASTLEFTLTATCDLRRCSRANSDSVDSHEGGSIPRALVVFCSIEVSGASGGRIRYGDAHKLSEASSAKGFLSYFHSPMSFFEITPAGPHIHGRWLYYLSNSNEFLRNHACMAGRYGICMAGLLRLHPRPGGLTEQPEKCRQANRTT